MVPECQLLEVHSDWLTVSKLQITGIKIKMQENYSLRTKIRDSLVWPLPVT